MYAKRQLGGCYNYSREGVARPLLRSASFLAVLAPDDYDACMAADYETDSECRWIEQFVREVAPAIDTAQCGRRLNGHCELWLRLLPKSGAQQLLITEAEYQQGEGDIWKEKIKTGLGELNS